MEKEHIIQPINNNIEKEAQQSFSNKEAQQMAQSVYPVETRSTINVENAINEQTRLLIRVYHRIFWVVFLLALPYVLFGILAITGILSLSTFRVKL